MKKFTILLFIIFPTLIFAQGSLLIIGGGSESDDEDAWSTAPYSWAVEQSANKKVAILSYSTATDWMRNYFVNHCGAVAARDFRINSQSIANDPDTYDSLMAYDVIFLKGGDQWNYYNIWKNTLTHEAIQEKFDEGGVICGTSAGLAVMSEVVFTAKNGTVYPDECIEDPNNQYVQLANDFFNFFPGYIFDSHFTDRGRGARMLGFLAHWKLNHNELIKGIGIDETTALAISQDQLGTVYGTGAANFYLPVSNEPYHQDGEMLIVDSIEIKQLLHGCAIDFNTGETTGLTEDFTPEIVEERGNYTILCSGGDALQENNEMLERLVNGSGNPGDVILIITGSDQSEANSFKTKLTSLGAEDVRVFSGISSMGDDPDFELAIRDANKYLFLGNEFYILEHFLEGFENGALLYDHIRRDDKVIAFVGDNSRFAGKTIIENYLLYNAAGTGTLLFKDGLNLLKTTVIIPNSYLNSDMFMNPAAGIPYAMLQEKMRFGIWLTRKNYLKYAPAESGTFITSYGDAPAQVLELQSTKGGFATKTYSANYSTPQMFAGFESMKMRLINSPVKIKTGEDISAYSIDEGNTGNFNRIKIYPNPTQNILTVESSGEKFLVLVNSADGKKIREIPQFNFAHRIDVSDLTPGFYFLQTKNEDGERTSQSFVITR